MLDREVRVLIVDDQEVFANALRLWLDSREGITVVATAHDGNEAVDLAMLHDAEIVLMDIGLPKCDGLEATRRLHTIKPEAKVIVLSGQTENQAKAAALDAGAVAFLTKGAVHDNLRDEILRVAG